MEFPIQKYPTIDWIKVLDPSSFDWRMNPNGRFQWLQRGCFWLLEKLGCKYPIETMQRVDIDVEGFFPAIEAQFRALQRRQVRPEPYFAICSIRDRRIATDEILSIHPNLFRSEIHDEWEYRFSFIQWRGITLLFVPWYTGAPVLMPRRLFETKPIG